MMLMAQKTRPGLKIMAVALVCCGILIPGLAWTTTQFPDILFLDGQKHFLDSLPLEQYYGPESPPRLSVAQYRHLARATSPPGRFKMTSCI